MIEKSEWKQVTVKEGKLYLGNGYLVWWRPEYTRASPDTPDEDVAYVLDVT